MYRGYRVVLVVPAGRKKYLELQLPYILKCREIVDEYRYWVNTTVSEDIEYMKHNARSYDGFVTCDTEDIKMMTTLNIYKFFKRTTDKGTIYVRLDDDIVWMEEDAIRKLLDFRIDNPGYFLVYGNIVNNTICDHIHQRLGVYNHVSESIDYDCLGNAWANPTLAMVKHRTFLINLSNNNVQRYKFSMWRLHLYERVSINCISWYGSEFAAFDGDVGKNEEEWLACEKPKELGKCNCICGSALFSHFAYCVQRDEVDKSDILARYRSLISL